MTSPRDDVLRHLRREARDGEISVWLFEPLLRDAGMHDEKLLSQTAIELVTTLVLEDGLVVCSIGIGRGVYPWKRRGEAAIRALIGMGLGSRNRLLSGICLIRRNLL